MTFHKFVRYISAGLLSSLMVVAVAAQDKAPSSAGLSPKEIAQGWIALFDGESTFGWKSSGKPTVSQGLLVLAESGKNTDVRTDFLFPKNFDLSVEVADAIDKESQFEIRYGATDPNFVVAIPLPGKGKTFLLKHRTEGKKIVYKVESPDGKVLNTRSFEDTYPGAIALGLRSGSSEVLKIKAIKFLPVGATSLFNGKDLSGWKVYKGDAKREFSKFAVTSEGDLSLKNGPGDLQTEQEFDNFLLQIECKSNGTALNSGIFFRCLPNQYQQGYEAQIQNGYKGEDRTKPTDFGTGAIYRRIPTRKVVSNDREWFTMTVLASGAHISTWVNGYPTVSWTDDRKAAENGRNGLYTKKGPISIQGHDVTTDLMFRNLRIVELK